MNSQTAPDFWKLYRRLPRPVREAARATYQQLCADPSHPSLHFERLVCDKRLWSVRITCSYRAVGVHQGNTITWIWVGDHADFDRTFPR